MRYNSLQNAFKCKCKLTWGFTGHCEKGGDAQGRSSGHRVDVHPEGDPGDDDDEDGGQVGLDHVKAQRPFQVQLGEQAAVVTWKK